MGFSDLSTVKFSQKLRPIADRIYKDKLGAEHVSRTRRPDGTAHILDKRFAIDLILRFSNGTILTGQEKFRTYRSYQKYGDQATIEYYQDPKAKVKGEFFHLASQFFFWGFSNKQGTGFVRCYCVDLLPLILSFAEGRIPYQVHTNRSFSRASFLAFSFCDIPAGCILFSK